MEQKPESRIGSFVESQKDSTQDNDHNVVFINQFKRSESYCDSLKYLAEYLSQVNQDLFNFAVDLGLSGDWEVWNRLQPPGSSVTITDECLHNIQDKYVRMIMFLRTEVQDAEGVVKNRISKMNKR